jgi:phosphoenolpyruvate-protein phosphotransferase (PTS system enzyme I)
MKSYKGIAVSAGIAIGEAFVYSKDLLIPKYSISELQIKSEIDRFYIALKQTKNEFLLLKSKVINEMSEDEGKFLDSHIMMTEDQALIKEVVSKLKTDMKNVEWVIYQVVDTLVKKFNKMDDEYFRDRAVDIMDIGRKVMQRLLTQKSQSLSSLTKDVIIISSDITVSDTASMNKKHVLAFITEFGGRTSHVSILAKALGIPSIFGIQNISHELNTGDQVIVDGINGKIIVNPTEKVLQKYQSIKQDFEIKENEFLSTKDLKSVTKDGREIKLKANMEVPEQEIDLAISHGAAGIGLYRSEFLYLSKKMKVLPSEEQQFNAYKFILEKFHEQEVTIRTLDLGGDKIIHEIAEKELNPYLGWRAIRFCLARKDIFKTQLRALYRASSYGNLQIMFPMISGLEEVVETKKVIKEVKQELRTEGYHFNENIPVGIMIETPAAAMMSDVLAKHVDFFSIGTNDLIQYTIACDRGNEKVAYLYEPLHPGVIRMLKIIIDNAKDAGIKVSLCGEMAADMENVAVLIGLGIDELSMSTVCILEIKQLVRNILYKEAKELVEELVSLNDYNQVIKKVKNWLRKHTNINYKY